MVSGGGEARQEARSERSGLRRHLTAEELREDLVGLGLREVHGASRHGAGDRAGPGAGPGAGGGARAASACEKLEGMPPEPCRPDLPIWSYVARFSLLLSTSYASDTFLKFCSAVPVSPGFLSGWYLIASFLYAAFICASVALRGTPSTS